MELKPAPSQAWGVALPVLGLALLVGAALGTAPP